MLAAALIALPIVGSGQAFASAGCSALSGYFDSSNYGYHGSSSGTGFDAGDTITVTYSHGNSGSTYTISQAGSSVYGPSSTSHTYVVPSTTSDTISISVNNTGYFYVSWSCAPGTPPSKTATTTTVSGSPNASTYGQNVTITAHVTGTGGPTGTVAFTIDGVNAGSSSLSSGYASISTSTLSVGNHSVVADYNGDSSNQTSSGNYTQTVNQASQTITFPALSDTAFTSTPPTPAATASSGLAVTYSSGTTGVCTVTSGGTISFVSAGICTIRADQAGNTNYAAASQVSQSFNVTPGVNTITFGTLPDRALGSGSFTVSATASSGLTVTFASATSSICSVSGTTVNLLAVGLCTITASQSGNANYQAATSVNQSFNITKAVATVSLSASSTNTLFGFPVTLTATVTGTSPTGSVAFLDGGTTIATVPLSGGMAAFTTKSLTTGAHSLTAHYSGDASNLPADSSSVSVAVSSRPDPSQDPDVIGLLNAQVSSLQRFGQTQIDNVESRLEQLHDDDVDNGGLVSFGVAFNNPGPASTGASAFPSSSPSADSLAYAPEGVQGRQMAGRTAAEAFDEVHPAMPFHVWVGGSVNLGKFDQTGGYDDRFTTSGVTVGVDRKIRSSLTIGLALGYATDETRIGTDGTKSRAREASVSAYASYRVLPALFLDMMGGYGHASLDSVRYSSPGKVYLQGSRGAKQLFGSVALTYEKKLARLRLAPYGRLDIIHSVLDAYSETGSPFWALSYQQMTTTALSGAIGFRATYVIPVAWGRLAVTGRVEDRARLQGSYNQPLSYADLVGGTVYDAFGQGLSSNQATFGIGLDGSVDGVRFGAEYQLSAGSLGDVVHTFRGGIRVPF